MQPFRFRLEKALEWFRRQCEIQENRLAVCLRARDALREQLIRLRAEREAVDRELIWRSSFTARDLSALGLYRLSAQHRAVRLEGEVSVCEEAVAAQRQVVEEARRRVRLVEKLRERRFTEHVYAETRELETVAAEAFLAKWIAGEERKCRHQRQS